MLGGMMDDGMGGMMDGQMTPDMHVIRDLLARHDKIRREVDDIDGGIRSRTTSTDARLAELIRVHARDGRPIEDNRPIRHGDLLFREIFEHHAAIVIDIIGALADGVHVTRLPMTAKWCC